MGRKVRIESDVVLIIRNGKNSAGRIDRPARAARVGRGLSACEIRLRAECSGDLLPPSPPAEKTTARQDQAGQASTSDGAGDGGCYRERSNRLRLRNESKRDVGPILRKHYLRTTAGGRAKIQRQIIGGEFLEPLRKVGGQYCLRA